jgi:hypothetical protein
MRMMRKIKLLRPGMNVDVDVHIKYMVQGDGDLVEYGFRRDHNDNCCTCAL